MYRKVCPLHGICPIFGQALAIRQELTGADTLDVATIVINLGSALLAVGQLDEAGICFDQA
jgi:hypothetical protein